MNTADPTYERAAFIQGQAGNFNSRHTSAVLNGPIVNKQLAGRLAVDYQSRETYIDYVNPRFAIGSVDSDIEQLNVLTKLLSRDARL